MLRVLIIDDHPLARRVAQDDPALVGAGMAVMIAAVAVGYYFG